MHDLEPNTNETILVPSRKPPGAELLSLPLLFSLWPIAASITKNLGVGDLINLSRSTSNLRATLHGGLVNRYPRISAQTDLEIIIPLRPPIGQHQTPHWALLKSITQFACSSKTHTRGEKVKGCVYCSQPICDACIVRDSFKNRNENSFPKRCRYLCQKCWSEGRPIKRFRYSPRPLSYGEPEGLAANSSIEAETTGSNPWDICSCTLRENGWLCLDCKRIQNSWKYSEKYSNRSEPGTDEVECYGLDCSEHIQQSKLDSEWRRVCLWCERALRRQPGSEGSNRRHAHMSAIRAVNVLSRAEEMQEFNRNYIRSLKMSRRELRGPNGQDDEELCLVRHLDTVNYRNYMSDTCCPSPEAVWKSKMGVWRYSVAFLVTVGQQIGRRTKYSSSGETQTFIDLTKASGLPFSRTNWELAQGLGLSDFPRPIRTVDHPRSNREALGILMIQALDLYLDSPAPERQSPKMTLEALQNILSERYGLNDITVEALTFHINLWLKFINRQNDNNRDTVESATYNRPPLNSHEDEDEEEDEDDEGPNLPILRAHYHLLTSTSGTEPMQPFPTMNTHDLTNSIDNQPGAKVSGSRDDNDFSDHSADEEDEDEDEDKDKDKDKDEEEDERHEPTP